MCWGVGVFIQIRELGMAILKIIINDVLGDTDHGVKINYFEYMYCVTGYLI